jgi:hypothetical protein
MLNSDYKDISQLFTEKAVKYLVIGAYAMSIYGYPRSTGDMDLWVEPSLENSLRVYEALKYFGAPMESLTPNTFIDPDLVFQIGVVPCRLDMLTAIDGVAFEEAYAQRNEVLLDGLTVPFISRQHLLKNKKSTGRAKDLGDVAFLES